MRECHYLVMVVAVVVTVYLLYHLGVPRVSQNVASQPLHVLKEEYSVWPVFSSKPPHTQEWYIKECFDGRFSSDLMEMFGSLIPTWAESLHPDCIESYGRYVELFEVHHRKSGPLEMSKSFEERVRGWLGGDELFREKVNKQTVIHVYHPLTAEHVIYNPVRAQRPMPDAAQDVFKLVDEMSVKTKAKCDFCHYKTQTAADRFGRHETQDIVRVTNTFKIEAHHSMVIPRHNHHPVNISRALMVKMFEEATQWFYDVSQQEPHYIYPNLAWDTLFHAGASQLHPHIHMMLAPDHYYGSLEGLRSAAQAYYRVTGRNYFSALVSIHATLGLAVEYGDAVALASLAGHGDMDVMILSDFPSSDLYSLIYFTIQAFHDTFRQPCKSLAGAWPALGMTRDASFGRIPALARLVSRGDCTSLRADFSSLEIFQAVFKPHDPWKIAAAVRKSIYKYAN